MSKLLEMFNEAVAKHKDFSMRNNYEARIQYPTGILPLDFSNGCKVHVCNKEMGKDYSYYSIGIVDGSYCLFIGRSGSGKTTLATQAAFNIVRPFPEGIVYMDNIEDGMDMQRALILSGYTPEQIRSKFVLKNTGISTETCWRRIKKIYDLKMSNPKIFRYDTGIDDANGDRIFKFQPTVYIIDSFAMLASDKDNEDDELGGSMSASASAKSLSSFIKKVIPVLKTANIILFGINHIRDKISINQYSPAPSDILYLPNTESIPGGKTQIQYANNIFKLKEKSKLTEGKDFNISGSETTIQMIKSRSGRNGSIIPLIFQQDIGFDPDLSLYITLKNGGYVGGAGAYYYIKGHDEIKFAQKNFKNLLYTNSEFKEIVVNAAKQLFDEEMEANKRYIEENNSAREDDGSYMISNSILNSINCNNRVTALEDMEY